MHGSSLDAPDRAPATSRRHRRVQLRLRCSACSLFGAIVVFGFVLPRRRRHELARAPRVGAHPVAHRPEPRRPAGLPPVARRRHQEPPEGRHHPGGADAPLFTLAPYVVVIGLRRRLRRRAVRPAR